MVTRALRWIWYVLVVRGLVLILLGVNVRHRERMPKQGPALIVANHNSHLDAMVLMSLLPASQIHAAHPVAAADYFLRNSLMAWFALNILGIIPLSRRMTRGEGDPLQPCVDALEAGKILIIFPEGSRGEPEELAEVKRAAMSENSLPTEDYLLGVPLLADYLEDGLDRLGISVEAAEEGIL